MRRLIIVAVALWSAQASAFVPTLTCTDTGLYACQANEIPKQVKWENLCISWYMNEAGTKSIPGAADGTAGQGLEDTIKASFDTWNAVTCQDLKLVYGGRTDDDRAATDGKANIVVFRDDDWRFASKTAFAITSVTYNPDSGLIVDADIEMNAFYHTFTIGDQDVNIDVQNTITHEVGHFVGLDHTPVPNATMVASAAVGETLKRSLESDDIEGVCSIYPTEARTDACSTPPPHVKTDDTTDDGCCTTAPGSPSRTPIYAILAGIGLVIWRRRARG